MIYSELHVEIQTKPYSHIHAIPFNPLAQTRDEDLNFYGNKYPCNSFRQDNQRVVFPILEKLQELTLQFHNANIFQSVQSSS